MSIINDARRALNARVCGALVDLAYALRDGRLDATALPMRSDGEPYLTPAQIQVSHDCIMVGSIERKTLDAEVRACVAPVREMAATMKLNDPDGVIIEDVNGRPLLTARHLDWARRAVEPMSEAQAYSLIKEKITAPHQDERLTPSMPKERMPELAL